MASLLRGRGEALDRDAPLILYCAADWRGVLAAATLEGMGFRQVAVLDGGINRWTTEGYPTEWGVNVPSKDFGEKIQVVHHVAEMHDESAADIRMD